MAQVKFIATTLTSKGRFGKGDVSNLFTDEEANDLQRLISVENPVPTVEETEVKKPKAKVKTKAKKKEVLTDKGYKVAKNDEYLKKEKIKNRIQHKAYRNRPLTHWQIQFNKLISKQRYKVERTFGGMSRWFGAGIARYKGLEKTHCQHVMESIAHNLKRSPGLVMVRCVQ